MKSLFIKIIQMTIYLVFSATMYNLFIVPINLVSGGTGGIGILFNNLFGMDRALVILIASVIIMVLSAIFLDKEQTFCAVMAAVVYPLTVKLTSGVSSFIEADIDHRLIVTIFGAVVLGAAQGVILSGGMNIGGINVISKSVYKYTKISITLTSAIINMTIVLLGAYFMGLDMILYAIIYIVIVRYVSERVMLGVSSNKTFKIISDQYEEIQKFIHEELKHDATLYDTIGSFDNDKRKMIMTIVPTSQYIVLKDFVDSVDKKAFVFVTNTYDVDRQDRTILKETV